MERCAKHGCDRKGEWAIEAHIPAKGWALDAHTPLSAICGMPLCRDCAAELNLLSTFPDLRQMLTETLISAGYVEPDFDRAWTTPIRRSSPKFLEFERAQSGRIQ